MQRATLNITAPLCCLHDALTSNKIIPLEDILTIVEQSLCFLGSANCQFSILRRKKILAAINTDKIGLADQSLPNASRILGMTFQQFRQSKLTYPEASLRTWHQLHDRINAPAQGLAVLLSGISPRLARTIHI